MLCYIVLSAENSPDMRKKSARSKNIWKERAFTSKETQVIYLFYFFATKANNKSL